MRYQRTWAWASVTAGLLGGLLALAGCVGTQLGFCRYGQGLHLLIPALALCGIGLACGGVWLARALKANRGIAMRPGLAGFVGTFLVLAIAAHYGLLALTKPPIHDVSTDIGDAPAFVDVLAQRAGAENPPGYDGPRTVRYDGQPMTTALAQKYAYPDIKPVERLAGTLSQKEFVAKYFWRSLNAVNALGWQVAGYDVKAGRIEATQKSFWFGVPSDIVIRVKPAGAIGVRVDIRAKSRAGEADRGFNAALVRTFMRRIKDG